MGNQTSQCFALYYLDSFDRYFKEVRRMKFYVRYMDDVVILVRDKKTAGLCLEEAAIFLRNEALLMNPKSACTKISCGIPFLGWRFLIADGGRIIQTPLRQSARRMLKKAKYKNIRYRRGEISWDRLSASKASYSGHLSQGNAMRLRGKILNTLFLSF